MFSIYHFFAHLLGIKENFSKVPKLENFPFDSTMLSCRNKGKFPHLGIRIAPSNLELRGGELIELKDSRSYRIPSFHSTIPTGQKEIRKVVLNEQSETYQQMVAAGENVYSLPVRDVFYLVRGRKGTHQKICLVHGGFFETVQVESLLHQIIEE